MIRFNDITAQLLSYHPGANLGLLQKAYVYSAKVHQGQIRLSGLPYLSHPLEVAHVLTQMKMDTVCIAAGLLHDTLEDTAATLPELSQLFGEETANIVDGVTKISQVHFTSSRHRQAENVRKMILAMSTDIRVILVKLADRLHNMRTLGYHSPEKQVAIARETLDIYAPLAGRMGMYHLKSNLEDLCLFYLEPEAYQEIRTEIVQGQAQKEIFIRDVIGMINAKLGEVGVSATVKGRRKNFYSIFKKMRDQSLDVHQVYDILAFRVIVSTIKECYEVLGHVHSMWKPVLGRFKDYISVPKANMYQSLHTTVIGPVGERMEIQIRTHEMDRVAEDGIAAHWKYKEGAVGPSPDDRQFAWLRQLLEWQQSLKDPAEFLETVRMDLFPDEVYVFTPKGEVRAFPKGATPLDFAYAIHSEVGDKCVGARVNGKMVPLRYELHNGNIVEIITSPKQQPRKDWLDFVKTPRARTKIRQWIKSQEREESLVLGRSLLEKALENEHLPAASILKGSELAAVAEEISFASVEDLIAQVGFGEISPKQVVGRIKAKLGIVERDKGLVSKMVGRIKRRKPTEGIRVRGVSDMLIRFANCCHPLPGERVVGYLTRGRGVTVHLRSCRHLAHVDPDRLVEVSWEPSKEDLHLARLKVTTMDQKGVLADVSAIMTQKNANIAQAEINATDDRKSVAYFTIQVENSQQLQEVIGALKKLKAVLMVERL